MALVDVMAGHTMNGGDVVTLLAIVVLEVALLGISEVCRVRVGELWVM